MKVHIDYMKPIIGDEHNWEARGVAFPGFWGRLFGEKPLAFRLFGSGTCWNMWHSGVPAHPTIEAAAMAAFSVANRGGSD